MYWHWTRIHVRFGQCRCMGLFSLTDRCVALFAHLLFLYNSFSFPWFTQSFAQLHFYPLCILPIWSFLVRRSVWVCTNARILKIRRRIELLRIIITQNFSNMFQGSRRLTSLLSICLPFKILRLWHDYQENSNTFFFDMNYGFRFNMNTRVAIISSYICEFGIFIIITTVLTSLD